LAASGLTALALLWALSGGRREPSLTTDTRSAQLATSAERLAFLGRYLKLRGRATDAWFHIVWHDNSQGLPGPSDWSIVAAIRVDPADGNTWLAGARPATPEQTPALFDGAAIAAGRRPTIPPEWNVRSPGTAYARDGALLIWHPEGVLEFSASAN